MESQAESLLLQHVLPHRGVIVEIGPQAGEWSHSVQMLRPSLSRHVPVPATFSDQGGFDAWALAQGIRRIACLSVQPPDFAASLLSHAPPPELLARHRIDALRFSGDASDAAARISATLRHHGYALFRLAQGSPVRIPDIRSGQPGDYFAMAPRFLPDPETGKSVLDIPRLLTRHAVKPRGVVHVGAHICQELPLYHSLGIPRVLFIEANPEICANIRTQFGSDAAVRIENFAIADTDGSLTLRLMTESQSSSILPLKHHREYYPEIHEMRQIAVPARRLDTLFRELALAPAAYNYLHMDIQGAEMLALRGAVSLLHHFDVVSMELNFDELYEGCALAEDLEDFLLQHDFHLAALLCPCSPSWGDALFVRGPFRAPRASVQFLGKTAAGAPVVSFGRC